MEKSSLKLISNIVLKSKVASSKDGIIPFLPFDLLSDEYNDVRNSHFLAEYQDTQRIKKMFAASTIIDED